MVLVVEMTRVAVPKVVLFPKFICVGEKVAVAPWGRPRALKLMLNEPLLVFVIVMA
jgi:hypothetical protein